MEVTPDGTVQLQEPAVVILSTVYVPTTVDVVTHGCGVEVSVKELVVTVALLASVTLTVIALEEEPPDVVPLMTPVLLLRLSPVGNEPVATENMFVPAPPEVAMVREYAVPLVAARPVVGVVMVSAVPAVMLYVSVVSIGANS
jgi:hypothetical protein